MNRLATFCDRYCPVCTRSRTKGGLWAKFVRFYYRACPMCRARLRETGKKPYEALGT